MLAYFFCALGVGAIWALQPIINAGLARSVGVVLASCISFGIGFAALVVAVLIGHGLQGQTIPVSAALQSGWQYYLGGIIGATVVLGMTFLVPLFGAGATIASAISGQLLMAAVIDQFGLFGATQVPLGPWRIFGFLCLIIGVNVVVRRY